MKGRVVGWGGGFKIHDRYAVVFPGWLEFYDGKDDCGSIDERKSCWMGWRPSESKRGIVRVHINYSDRVLHTVSVHANVECRRV